MAQRRMFSNRIANSARFLQMPTEAQLLYFHLVLRADDDGIVEAYPILRLLSLPTDNYKILMAKGLIQPLNEEQVIVIMDWKEHNTIRADRKVDSIYLPLLKNKFPELPLVIPVPRADTGKINTGKPGRPIRVKTNGHKLDGISKDILYLSKIPVEDAKELGREYHTDASTVIAESKRAYNHLLSKGEFKEDYKAYLHTWLSRMESFTQKAKSQAPSWATAALAREGDA